MTIVLFSVVDYNGFSNELFSSFWPRRRPPSTVHNSKTYYYNSKTSSVGQSSCERTLLCASWSSTWFISNCGDRYIRMKALFNDPQFIRRSLANPFIHRRSRSLDPSWCPDQIPTTSQVTQPRVVKVNQSPSRCLNDQNTKSIRGDIDHELILWISARLTKIIRLTDHRSLQAFVVFSNGQPEMVTNCNLVAAGSGFRDRGQTTEDRGP